MEYSEKDYEVKISVETAISGIEKLIPILLQENVEKGAYLHSIDWYTEELNRLKVLPPERILTRSMLNKEWLLIVQQNPPMQGRILSLKIFKEDIRRFITHFDGYSKIVSNTGYPRKDNDYGRAAETLENALEAIKQLQ